MEKVLITGGNKGIGLEATKIFIEKGYEVVVAARDFENFIFENHPQVRTVCFDVSEVDKIAGFVKEIGYVDILINNAGVMNSVMYNDYAEDKKENLMNVNLYSVIEFITCMSALMIEKKKGRIVNTASIAGHIGHPDIWYGISKAGVINATKSFAKLLAPYGIVINAVAPGPVETEMLNVIPEARKKAVMDSVYINRFAKAYEVARTIYWLAAESPEYINGTCIDINNGAFPR